MNILGRLSHKANCSSYKAISDGERFHYQPCDCGSDKLAAAYKAAIRKAVKVASSATATPCELKMAIKCLAKSLLSCKELEGEVE